MDQHTAVMALHALNGLVFDLEKGSTLYIDLAKSNSRSKRPRADNERQGSEKRQKGSAAFSRIHDHGLGSIHMPGISNSAYNTTIAYPSTQRCRGFIKLKMQSTYGAPVAFVDFQDTSCSTEALSYLQGTVLYSSTTGEGMRLEYAKSRMGMRSKKST